MWPYFLLVRIHLAQPIPARARIVLTTDPPLPGQRKVVLEEVQKISRRHGATGEEMCAHPAVFEIVGGFLVGEDMHE